MQCEIRKMRKGVIKLQVGSDLWELDKKNAELKGTTTINTYEYAFCTLIKI